MADLAANGWDAIPIDWPAPHLVVLPPEGLRNTLTRRPKPTFRSLLPGGQTAAERAQAITDQLMRGTIAWPHVPFGLSPSAPAAENARRLLGIGVDPDRVIDGELGRPEVEDG